MKSVPCIHWADVVGKQEFHAALIAASPARGWHMTPHFHDFYEMMFVLSGTGRHWVNGEWHSLHGGDLLLVRPSDHHAGAARPRDALQFINVAFSGEAWQQFGTLLQQETVWRRWDRADKPLVVRLSAEQRQIGADIFRRALYAFQEHPTRLELCRFWSGAVALLLGEESKEPQEPALYPNLPPYLERACRAMQHNEALQAGLPRLLEFSGVTLPHLCRTMRAYMGLSPTQWINQQRLRRAAHRLAATTEEVTVIAFDCGFQTPSLFYRLFRQQYGQTPGAYRRQARQSVAPQKN